MKTMLEIEDKWDVDNDFVLPADIAADAADRSTVELNSVYYDTAEHDLQSHGLSLRKREGDDDAGWHIKVPTADGRLELRAGPSDTPPDELTDLLTGVRLGKPLIPVATIRTQRDRYRIVDDDGQTLRVELVDDHVRASSGHQLLAWREIEVEEGPAAGSLRRKLARRLVKAGAQLSPHPSKLARISPQPRPTSLKGSIARETIARYVRKQIEEIFAGDLGLRSHQDPIHDTRVATRRLRSTLRVFGKSFEADAATHLDTELKWFAGLLGDVRDHQLQRRRLDATLDEWPPELILGPVVAHLDSDLRATELRARADVSEAMNSERYLALLSTLQQWATDLPMTAPPTRKSLKSAARKARRKADRRLVEAIGSHDDALLHRARKAAKRARYAVELSGEEAKQAKEGKHYKRIQRVLGDYQDSVVAAETLYRLGISAGTAPGENGFTFGLLYARERQLQKELRDKTRRLV